MMHAALQLALIVTSFSGITINGFAVAVNLWDWKSRGDLKASDHYICSVALSNLSLELWLGFTWHCDNGWNYDTFCHINFTLMMISTQYSMVAATTLCCFFCSKIVVFNHWLLQMYSRQYSESYKKILFRAVLICTVLGLPLFWIKKQEPSTNSDSPFLNISSFSKFYDTQVERYFEGYKMFILSFGYILPLLLTLVSAGCISVSLMKHMKRMRGTMEKKHEVLTDAHRRATVTVLSLLVLILTHFVISIIILIKAFPEQDLRSTLCKVISRLYAPTLGIVLVRGNSKLRSAASEIKRKVIGTLKLMTSKRENASVHII